MRPLYTLMIVAGAALALPSAAAAQAPTRTTLNLSEALEIAK